MEILNDFGVNWTLLIAQIINFLIVLYILKRFLYKKILDSLKDRQKVIKEGLAQAEESRKLLEKAEIKQKEIIKNSQEEAKKIIEETRKQRDLLMGEADANAKAHAEKILEEARKQINIEAREAQRSLSRQMTGLAVEFLQKSAGSLFTKEDQEKVIKRAVEKLKKRVD